MSRHLLRGALPVTALAAVSVFASATPASTSAASASAASGTRIACVSETQAPVTPGMTLDSGLHKFASSREQKSSCSGVIDGRKADTKKPTVVTYHGELYGSCTQGSDAGALLTAEIPLEGGGTRSIRVPYTLSYVLPVGGKSAQGNVNGAGLHGEFAFTPVKGDCVTKPMALATVAFTFTYVVN